jgi:hypothetical protein
MIKSSKDIKVKIEKQTLQVTVKDETSNFRILWILEFKLYAKK